MKIKSKTYDWLQGENTPEPDQIGNTSLHNEYSYEGDEFLDDAIRTVDQAFGQIDGSFEVWQRRKNQLSNSTNEFVNSKNNPI
jgi:hypothetical protein